MDQEKLVEQLAKWMIAEHARIHGLVRVRVAQKNVIIENARKLVTSGQLNKTLRVYILGNSPLAVINIAPAHRPRIAQQKSIFFIYNGKARRKVMNWLKQTLVEVASKAPRYTQLIVAPGDDRHFRSSLESIGYKTRYEILAGDTKTALACLKSKRNPRRDLRHLELDLKEISSVEEIPAVMALQKRVSIRSKRHGYFSHLPAQLERDRSSYYQIIRGKNEGSLLGVYRGQKLLGAMLANISGPERVGGFSFFIDSSIQGLGITKTGYLLLLEFFARKKVKTFFGGTSQPAIQSLGKIMKREIQSVIYVKMGG